MRLISINDIFKIFRFKYRKQVVKLSNSIKSVEIKTDFFKNINYKSLQLNESVAIPDKIKIASGSINMTNALYNHDFDDNEDFFSIHRFVWLLLSLDEGVSKIKIDWVQTQILKWCLQYEDKFDDKRVFEPYSVSERLVSWCYILIFVGEYIKDIKFWKIIRISFESQLLLLIHNLEYHGKFTNNHILNNAQCLYTCGRILKLDAVEKLGKEIIHTEFQCTVHDGVFQEGSTHYQFLLTKSFLELMFIAKLTKDTDFEAWLTPNVQKMCYVCDLLSSDFKADEYPLFGDISPDVNPEWMLGYPFLADSKKISPWQNLFQLSIPPQICTLISGKSNIEYIKLIGGIWEVWINIKKIGVLGHGHNDNGQVVIYKEGRPVLVDLGRGRYTVRNDSLAENQIDPEFHSLLRFKKSPTEYYRSQGILEFLSTRSIITSRSENSIKFDIVYYSGKVVSREVSIEKGIGVKIIDRLKLGSLKENFMSTWHFASSEGRCKNEDHKRIIDIKDCATVKIIGAEDLSNIFIEHATRSTSYGNNIPAIALNIEGVISINNFIGITIC